MDFKTALSNAKTTVTLTPDSLILEKENDVIRVYYLYTRKETETDRKTGEVTVRKFVYFFDGQKILFNMGVTLVEQFVALNIPAGTPVEIKLKQLKKRDGGKTLKIYSVTPLDAAPLDVQSVFGGINILPHAPEKLLQTGASMTYEQAVAHEFVNKGKKYAVGQIGDPEKLRIIAENAAGEQTREAAKIVLEHDFTMTAAAQDIAAASADGGYIPDTKEAVNAEADEDEFPF